MLKGTLNLESIGRSIWKNCFRKIMHDVRSRMYLKSGEVLPDAPGHWCRLVLIILENFARTVGCYLWGVQTQSLTYLWKVSLLLIFINRMLPNRALNNPISVKWNHKNIIVTVQSEMTMYVLKCIRVEFFLRKFYLNFQNQFYGNRWIERDLHIISL